jgi:O-methyltransferase involved in polyketide biosynthesis
MMVPGISTLGVRLVFGPILLAHRLSGYVPRMPRYERVRSFELDTPPTQAVKREMLKKAGIDASRVTFAAADFMQENWLVKLIEAGFDMTQPALFIWEGVVMYPGPGSGREHTAQDCWHCQRQPAGV